MAKLIGYYDPSLVLDAIALLANTDIAESVDCDFALQKLGNICEEVASEDATVD